MAKVCSVCGKGKVSETKYHTQINIIKEHGQLT